MKRIPKFLKNNKPDVLHSERQLAAVGRFFSEDCPFFSSELKQQTVVYKSIPKNFFVTFIIISL